MIPDPQAQASLHIMPHRYFVAYYQDLTDRCVRNHGKNKQGKADMNVTDDDDYYDHDDDDILAIIKRTLADDI